MSAVCVLVDAGIGNLHSAEKAFRRMAPQGAEIAVTADPDRVRRADRVVLPGDGAFPHCMEALEAASGLREALEEATGPRGRPFLGICVGMQLMATRGLEFRDTAGLGWLKGTVRPIQPADPALKVPHMGWNDLVVDGAAHPVLDGIATGDHAYFVHGFALDCDRPEDRLAWADHGGPLTAVAGDGGTRVGVQFHPEKSQAAGLRIIANFLRWAP